MKATIAAVFLTLLVSVPPTLRAEQRTPKEQQACRYASEADVRNLAHQVWATNYNTLLPPFISDLIWNKTSEYLKYHDVPRLETDRERAVADITTLVNRNL